MNSTDAVSRFIFIDGPFKKEGEIACRLCFPITLYTHNYIQDKNLHRVFYIAAVVAAVADMVLLCTVRWIYLACCGPTASGSERAVEAPGESEGARRTAVAAAAAVAASTAAEDAESDNDGEPESTAAAGAGATASDSDNNDEIVLQPLPPPPPLRQGASVEDMGSPAEESGSWLVPASDSPPPPPAAALNLALRPFVQPPQSSNPYRLQPYYSRPTPLIKGEECGGFGFSKNYDPGLLMINIEKKPMSSPMLQLRGRPPNMPPPAGIAMISVNGMGRVVVAIASPVLHPPSFNKPFSLPLLNEDSFFQEKEDFFNETKEQTDEQIYRVYEILFAQFVFSHARQGSFTSGASGPPPAADVEDETPIVKALEQFHAEDSTIPTDPQALPDDPTQKQALRSKITKAYRKLAMKLHPDKHPNEHEKYSELFKQLHENFSRLDKRLK